LKETLNEPLKKNPKTSLKINSKKKKKEKKWKSKFR
jgi:hypothetical protein